ncbi:MAG: putative MPP superfamily phosphohydrolase, partial [Glaciecola sp.]
MYDLVGDIHGFDGPFVALLKKLGYADIEGVWQHPTRILISLGDLVDRGPGQKKVVDILKNMQQHGKAIVIMGNHEFYAVAWHLKGPNGKPLRPHSEKNYNEHRAFLEQASQGSPWYIDAINWFKTLPLFFETDDIRCIHAA